LYVIKIKDPANPVVTGTHPMSSPVRGIAVLGNHIYVAAGCSGMWIMQFNGYQPPPD